MNPARGAAVVAAVVVTDALVAAPEAGHIRAARA
jgi:hypothetical protein